MPVVNVRMPVRPSACPGSLRRDDFQANFAGAEWTDDEAFTVYGLDDATIAALRFWVVQWVDDLAARLLGIPAILTSTEG
ncbi:hypothetical protein [Streptomyces sp. NPDC088733]|uniref:hypothetical protein n=1 Tax=Streptomyces sp. NPDC088733 TaxID=3365880 RepID=UPI0037F4E145